MGELLGVTNFWWSSTGRALATEYPPGSSLCPAVVFLMAYSLLPALQNPQAANILPFFIIAAAQNTRVSSPGKVSLYYQWAT